MALHAYFPPFLSDLQQAQIAFYEFPMPFEPKVLEGPRARLRSNWRVCGRCGTFRRWSDGDLGLPEASCIVAYVDPCAPGPLRPIPADPRAALEVRLLDRFFDHHVSTPQQKVVFDAIRPPEARDMLITTFAWLDTKMA